MSLSLNKFIKGLVTDGDLRRELQNYEKNQNLNKFLKKDLVVNESMPASKALGIMNEKKLQVYLLFLIMITQGE